MNPKMSEVSAHPVGMGDAYHCARRWNQLDLAIVLLSVMGIILEEIEISAALPINPTIIRIMRVLRIARGESLLLLNLMHMTCSQDGCVALSLLLHSPLLLLKTILDLCIFPLPVQDILIMCH